MFLNAFQQSHNTLSYTLSMALTHIKCESSVGLGFGKWLTNNVNLTRMERKMSDAFDLGSGWRTMISCE